jgi:hypothetical protein
LLLPWILNPAAAATRADLHNSCWRFTAAISEEGLRRR